MFKGLVGRLGQEIKEWKEAVNAVQEQVEGGKGLHQLETARRNTLRRTDNEAHHRTETSGRGKETERN